ncbi:hypothetical protein OIK44_14710 [Janthinobacterium sp. hw3]|uniref:Uncharacterized protein n=2 Tax=Janthinobacterium fluminis TaxID=2987524 RepID=A0ABT5K4Z8_9BURK|nr:hypothetical protein [Janthinobacterium fluminis]
MTVDLVLSIIYPHPKGIEMRITASCLILFTFLNTSSKAAEFTRESPSTIHMAGAISDGDLQKIEKSTLQQPL